MRLSSVFTGIIVFITGISLAQAPLKKTNVLKDGFSITIDVPTYKKELSKSGSTTIVDYIDFTDPGAPGSLKLPAQDIIVAIPKDSKPTFNLTVLKSNTLKNTAVTVNPAVVLKGKNDYTLDQHPKTKVNGNNSAPKLEVVRHFWYRDLYCAQLHVKLADFNYSANTVEEITSYKITVTIPGFSGLANTAYTPKNNFEKLIPNLIANSEIAGAFRAKLPRPASDSSLATWINYSAPYIKIGVIEDRIYRINKQDIEALGYSTAGIDPKTFQLFENGVEIPVTLNIAQAGSFGQSDYIEFYGHKNYSPVSARIVNSDTEDYNEYLNPFSDTTVYFLTWGTKNGLRANASRSALNSASDSLTYYTCFLHHEVDTLYQTGVLDNILQNDPTYHSAKSWFDGYLFNSTGISRQFKFSSADAVAGKPARFWAKMISYALNQSLPSHQVVLGIKTNPKNNTDTNVTILQQAAPVLNERLVMYGSLDAKSLQPDSSILVLKNRDQNSVTPNNLLFDWFEVEYPRLLKANNDSLYFELRDTITAAIRKIKVSNVQADTGSLTIYRIKPYFMKITGAVKNGTDLWFTDTVSTGSGWYVIPTQSITAHKPLYLHKKSFLNLRSPNHSADYIAISHPSLFNAATTYTGFIHNTYSLDTALVMVDDIYDEFAYGYPVPASIKAFLQSCFFDWKKQPAYLMLIGQPCYDYKNNLGQTSAQIINTNLVPSYSEPISDPWFTMLNTNDPYIPQMLVGRLPVSSETQLNSYLAKHQTYISQRYDLFNKRALFFSGGLDSTECQNLRTRNDILIAKYAAPAPGAYNYVHFYKNNSGDKYGPFDPTTYDNEIKKGGLFIAYLGHSGTQTWDNGVESPNALLNDVNKGPVVTDFGCSTNKIAEPNVKAFGDLFVTSGQSMSYLGNSSLGFTLTSYTAPDLFYSSLLKDTVRNIAQSHLDAKMQMMTSYGSSGVYHIFAMTNILVGDPVLRIASPKQQNLVINATDIRVTNKDAQNDGKGAADTVQFVYYNYGTMTGDSADIRFEDHYEVNGKDSVLTKVLFRRPPIGFTDTLAVIIPTAGRPGAHTFTVTIDPSNKLTEMYKDDNTASLKAYVSSLSTRNIIPGIFSSETNSLTILSPGALPDSKAKETLVQIDSTGTFKTPVTQKLTIDTFFTKVPLASLKSAKRYWVRTSLNQSDTLWSSVFNFYKSDKQYPFMLEDSISFMAMDRNHLQFSNGLKVLPVTTEITLGSGNHTVKKGSIQMNGKELLPSSFDWGMACAVIDPYTFHVDAAQTYWYGDNPAQRDSMVALINRTPAGKYVCIIAIDDAMSSFNSSLRNAIVSCGSAQIDKLPYFTSWYLFGIKGAKAGTVPEKIGDATTNALLTFDTSFVNSNPDSISLKTTQISGATKYNAVYMNATIPSNTAISVTPIGYKADGTAVNLSPLSFSSAGTADISGVSPDTYPSLAFQLQFKPDPGKSFPNLQTFAVDYTPFTELGVNYQSVSAQNDSFVIGKTNKFLVTVNNAGTAKADSVKILSEIIYPDNTKETLDSRTVASIPAETRYAYTIPYNVPLGNKDRTFRITVDPDNKIKEFYKDNNTFSYPFSITVDTTLKPALEVLFDSVHVFDGDFVSATPKILIELNDPSTLPMTDTSFVDIQLDDQRIPFNSMKIPPSYNLSNPKLVVTYTPNLTSGDHVLRIMALSASKKDTLKVDKSFSVNTNLQLLSVYNYPNPMKDKTWFTFVLPQVPEQLQLKIYTIAGRLIRKLQVPSTELSTGFNKSIMWDGRDEDGDLVANGTYLYKILIRQNGKSVETVSKLAIVR